jgi:hypothetical protein
MNKFLEATIRLFGTPKWAILRAQRLSAIKKRFPDGKVSPHCHITEFFCRDGMPPPIRALNHLQWYAKNIIEPMRVIYGPCMISGPYRHYWYNKNVVHGATLSWHVWDRYVDGTVPGSELACDLSFATGLPDQWAKTASTLLRKLGRGGGVGIYRKSRFTHVDTRHNSARWVGN